jgi:hypothetical protein
MSPRRIVVALCRISIILFGVHTRDVGGARMRVVDYSSGYLVVEGELTPDPCDGRTFTLATGQTYVVSDGQDAHRSRTERGARLFIVD